MSVVVGVDGCAAGWVAVAWRGARVEARVFETFDAVMAAWADASVIGVDMPVGLVARGPRSADAAARAYLAGSGRSASVFSVPPRRAVAATTYAEACRRALADSGKQISQQSFRLFAKIREVDAYVADPRVVEVHPECSFATMAGAPARRANKKTWAGAAVRRALLAAAGLEVPAEFPGADRVGLDDVLDAAAVAWTARRVSRGEARALPPAPAEHDACGRLVQILA